LDEIPGVGESRVDWSGRLVLLEVEPGSPVEQVFARADEILEGGTQRLDPRSEAEAIADYRQGAAWMRAGETLRLSRHEAGVLARNLGVEAAREAGLDGEETQRFIAVVEQSIAAAFERIHAAGQGLPSSFGERAIVLEDVLEKCRDFLSEEKRARLEAALRAP